LPEKDRFTRLRTERKHFVDTIKMIAYRARPVWLHCFESTLFAPTMRAPFCVRSSKTKWICYLDSKTNTLTVRLHHLTHATHDRPVAQLCAALNETQTVFPGTNLTLIFKIGSSEVHRDQEV